MCRRSPPSIILFLSHPIRSLRFQKVVHKQPKRKRVSIGSKICTTSYLNLASTSNKTILDLACSSFSELHFRFFKLLLKLNFCFKNGENRKRLESDLRNLRHGRLANAGVSCNLRDFLLSFFSYVSHLLRLDLLLHRINSSRRIFHRLR
ncbi:hypothetical protein L1987_69764 [Smallanthus sonchifolius]|uniref:Uncharacterized protein n=1 Tax=Smallanthus sonchifolius TaxID=185202 RepID=A0ACB9B717_9ASTR|nr:hypothetical protein L1987_69764 [Smallanthus sonchifolius]